MFYNYLCKIYIMITTPYVLYDTCHVPNGTCQVSGVTCQVSHVTSKSQTVRARELKIWEKVELLPPATRHMSCVTCHMSHVMSHMSCVTFHVSHVMCHMSCVTCHVSLVMWFTSHFMFFLLCFLQDWEACLGRVCYQPNLPRLVLIPPLPPIAYSPLSTNDIVCPCRNLPQHNK